jgi:glutamate-5-semialdehyde dehydrogenase
LERRLLDDGLLLEKVSFPIGVIGMIFEARPDALVQIVSLCLKSGNGIILKGGKEAERTNTELVASIQRSCKG